MQGRSPPSFFLTKKIGAPAGEEDWRINPFAKFSSIYEQCVKGLGFFKIGEIIYMGCLQLEFSEKAATRI